MKWNNIEDIGYTSKLEKLKKLQPHEIFNISNNANIREIKKAYKEKMKIYHPDKNGNFTKEYSEEISKILNNAYQKMSLRNKNAN